MKIKFPIGEGSALDGMSLKELKENLEEAVSGEVTIERIHEGLIDVDGKLPHENYVLRANNHITAMGKAADIQHLTEMNIGKGKYN